MSDLQTAYVGATVLDADGMHTDHALVVSTNGQVSVIPRNALPDGCPTKTLNGGTLTPGFVDLQVGTLGTQALLPTLITDTPDKTRAAIDAVANAIKDGVPGIVGLHLEGPHLSVARKGAHDGSLVRKMEDDDLSMLLATAETLPNLMVTVAPESTTNAQIKELAKAGIVVSLGHTDADAQTCHAVFDAGARCVTHLFNAMSQLTSREPGLVGATLERDDIYAGLIADGIHVDPATIRIALEAKMKPERIFLVTDAMATAGSEIDHFELGGRRIEKRDNRLTLDDGTLAGAHLDLGRAVDVMMDQVGDSVTDALARAITTPTELLRDPMRAGRFTHLDSVLYVPDGQTNPVKLTA